MENFAQLRFFIKVRMSSFHFTEDGIEDYL